MKLFNAVKKQIFTYFIILMIITGSNFDNNTLLTIQRKSNERLSNIYETTLKLKSYKTFNTGTKQTCTSHPLHLLLDKG